MQNKEMMNQIPQSNGLNTDVCVSHTKNLIEP